MSEEQVVILDFGSQYTRLIAKTLRELQVYCRVVAPETTAEQLRRLAPKGLILSGGPASVYEKDAPRLDPAIYHLDIPILAICYGMQLVGRDRGGRVAHGQGEYGTSILLLTADDPLFAGLSKEEPVWMSHGDHVEALPKGYRSLARSTDIPYATIKSADGKIYGLQFHPEVSQTIHGKMMLRNWVERICGITLRWQAGDTIEERITRLSEQLKGKCALIAFSGGVDSSTAAVLTHRAIGDRLLPIFIDSGLLRAGDRERTQRVAASLELKLHTVDAPERFFKALRGVTDPEAKRRTVGEAFIRAFEAEAESLERQHGPIKALIQGTIYSDVIESGGSFAPSPSGRPESTVERPKKGFAERIKSHHNVGGLPSRLNLEIIEPLRDLFKDEVRQIAQKLNLPDEIIWEQPFPGPGLAVRILGEVTPDRVALLQRADAILREEIKQTQLDREIWQYFAVLLPGRSVAVRGDGRGYGAIIALRAVASREGMTAEWFPLPYPTLQRISTRITNEVEAVTRVVYDITSKPPATIEWE